MSPEPFFSIVNLVAGMGWAVLLLAPRTRWVADSETKAITG